MAKLLLVEDTPEIWDFLSRRLKRREHDVVLAHDGQAGLEMARAEHPQVILLDMNLPVMDGWTAARTLRASEDTAKIAIIALTAHAMSGDRNKVIEAGCDDYHPKPVDFAKLLGQIDAALLDRPVRRRVPGTVMREHQFALRPQSAGCDGRFRPVLVGPLNENSG